MGAQGIMATSVNSSVSFNPIGILSRLLLAPGSEELKADLLKLSPAEFDELLTLAKLNHVVVRGLEVIRDTMWDAGNDARAEWAEAALETERARITNALPVLQTICRVFEKSEYGVTVIKSLDHWPDFGSDVDLYTSADARDVCEMMKRRFDARTAPRSWGDHLARKWNFIVPGLPELVEIHIGRLGQTGEQVAIASSLLKRTRTVQAGGHTFRVPSVSDRLMISTLQRMYRHFYFRLCDIVDSAGLVETGPTD